MTGEAGEARLAVDGRKDVEGELLWTLDDDVVAGWVPADHVVVFRTLEETTRFATRSAGSALVKQRKTSKHTCKAL